MTNPQIRLLADRHPSQSSMARELGCSREWARRLCDRAGVLRFRKGAGSSLDDLEEWVVDLLSSGDVAMLLGIPEKSIRGRRNFANRSLVFRVRMHAIRKLWNRGLSACEISELLEVRQHRTEGTITYWRNKGMRFDRRYRKRVSGP